MKKRRSYRGLMKQPAWGLYDAHGKLLMTCRALTAEAARDLFREYKTVMLPSNPDLTGARIRAL